MTRALRLDNLNPLYRMCNGKKSFETHAKARKWLRHFYNPVRGLKMRAYHCPHCNAHHLTSQPKREDDNMAVKKKTRTVTKALKPTGLGKTIAEVSKQAPKSDPISRVDEKMSKRRELYRKQVADAKALHEEYQEGFNPDRLSASAHATRILAMLGLEPNFYIEGTQLRKQVGLAELDVLALAFEGTLAERLVSSRLEVEEKAIDNNERARIEAEKKRRKSARGN